MVKISHLFEEKKYNVFNFVKVNLVCSIFFFKVKKFLESHKEFVFVKDRKVSPSKSGFDGFYMALLERTC